MEHMISLDRAIEMTTLFRAQKENLVQPSLQGQNILPICETFSRGAFDSVLSQTGCAGLRIYYGLDEGYRLHAVINGVDVQGADILPTTSSAMRTTTEEDTGIIETGHRCPDICPPDSPLNSPA